MNQRATIFIQIAAYRDLELIPTIQDAVDQAAYPSDLHFGICWQFAEEKERDYIAALYRLRNCRIISMPSARSRGVGWARAKAQSLWAGETYTLQIDAHMRFVHQWDRRLVEMLAQCDAPKPVLSAYPPAYVPPRILLNHRPRGLALGKSIDEMIRFKSTKDYLDRFDTPRPGLFMAAGFLFAKASLISEVPYDPSIYFDGEEILLSARAWTRGWDIFHPHKVVCWHYYNSGKSRKRPVHWKDKPGQYSLLHRFSLCRYRKVLAGERGKFGLGDTRGLNEYAKVSGIHLHALTYKPENDFLYTLVIGECFRMGHNSVSTRFKSRNLNWRYIIDRSLHLGILPYLYQNITGMPQKVVPEEIHREISDIYIAGCLRNRSLITAQLKLAEFLSAKQVSIQPIHEAMLLDEETMKCIQLTNRLDYLILESDAPLIRKCLADLGYLSSNAMQRPAENRSAQKQLVETFEHLKKGHSIRLHHGGAWQKLMKGYRNPPATICHRDIAFIQTSEDLMVSLFATRLGFSIPSCIFAAQWIRQRNVNWERVMALSRKLDCEWTLFPSIVIADRAFDIHLSREVVQRLCRYPEIARLRDMDIGILL